MVDISGLLVITYTFIRCHSDMGTPAFWAGIWEWGCPKRGDAHITGKTLDNNNLNQVGFPAVLVKTRV